MTNIKLYNIYLFISSFTRNIIDIYSIVLLHQKGITINNIIGIYGIIYFIGSYISTLSLTIGNKIGFKYILMASSIITSISFYIINNISNIYLIAVSLSLSIFTYHPIRHYYGIKFLSKKEEIGNTIILTYIATIISSLFAIKDTKTIYLVIISLISIIPTIFIKKEPKQNIKYHTKINSKKLNFFILDQTKIIFLLLQPLYLYKKSKNITQVGLFNIVISISSILYIYKFAKNKNIEKYYRYINIIFTIILLLKLNINNHILMLLIAFLEGIGIKTNELVSTMNLYQTKSSKLGYLIISEMFFCLVRGFILSTIYILKINLKQSLYILIIGVFLLSFQYQKIIHKIDKK